VSRPRCVLGPDASGPDTRSGPTFGGESGELGGGSGVPPLRGHGEEAGRIFLFRQTNSDGRTAQILTTESDERRQMWPENSIHYDNEVPISCIMTTNDIIRFAGGTLITAIVVVGFASEVFADEAVRVEGASPATKPDVGMASTAGANGPSSSPRLVAGKPTIAETNAIEGLRLAAEDGVAQAQFSLGLRYENGTGVAKDPVQAIHWVRKAAEQGYDEAQYMLGCWYNGEDGFAKDPIEAAKWWEKAAAQGHADAQHCLALSYSIGQGVTKNPAEAVKWWRKAAEKNNVDAEFFLGLSYAEGLGVPKTPEQAVYWLRQAAAHGNESALTELRKLGADRDISARN
jgi:TPR repeat protein